jgi:hypothetical protein
MDVITPTIKPSIDALKSILGAARRKWGKRKYEKLLATTFSELLKEHPDLTAAEANLAAAEGRRSDARCEFASCEVHVRFSPQISPRWEIQKNSS